MNRDLKRSSLIFFLFGATCAFAGSSNWRFTTKTTWFSPDPLKMSFKMQCRTRSQNEKAYIALAYLRCVNHRGETKEFASALLEKKLAYPEKRDFLRAGYGDLTFYPRFSRVYADPDKCRYFIPHYSYPKFPVQKPEPKDKVARISVSVDCSKGARNKKVFVLAGDAYLQSTNDKKLRHVAGRYACAISDERQDVKPQDCRRRSFPVVDYASAIKKHKKSIANTQPRAKRTLPTRHPNAIVATTTATPHNPGPRSKPAAQVIPTSLTHAPLAVK